MTNTILVMSEGKSCRFNAKEEDFSDKPTLSDDSSDGDAEQPLQ